MKTKKKYKETKNRKKLKKLRLQKQPGKEVTPAHGLGEKLKKKFQKLNLSVLWEKVNAGDIKSRLNIAALALMPVLLLLITQLITAQSSSALLWGFGHLWAFLLGWIVLVGVCALLYGVFGKLWLTWLLAAAPCVLVALVNHYKMELHGAPLMMNDFTLLGQFGIIAGYAMPNLRFSFATIASLMLAVALPVGLYLAEKGKRMTIKTRGIWSAVGAVVCALSLFCLPGSALTERAAAGATTQAERVDSAGVLTGLYCAWAGDQTKAPVVNAATLQESVQNTLPEEKTESQPIISSP